MRTLEGLHCPVGDFREAGLSRRIAQAQRLCVPPEHQSLVYASNHDTSESCLAPFSESAKIELVFKAPFLQATFVLLLPLFCLVTTLHYVHTY